MSRALPSLLFAALSAPLLAGCGMQCIAPCERLYTSPDGCQIQRPGADPDELYDECFRSCSDAMATPGELEGYDPNERQGSSASVSLDNRAQAQFWSECIEQTSCGDLESGYCAPVW